MSTAEGEEGYNIRFRHIGGDLGPFVFNKNCTVLNLKERLMQEWSTGECDCLQNEVQGDKILTDFALKTKQRD